MKKPLGLLVLLLVMVASACGEGRWGEGRCSLTDLSSCAAGEICQDLAGGVCAAPCGGDTGDADCVALDPALVCHPAAGGRCAPPCDPAGLDFDCADLTGALTTCDASTLRCVGLED